jgi:Protein of unknown function (DUF3485)
MRRYVAIVVAISAFASVGAFEVAQMRLRADLSDFVAAQRRFDSVPLSLPGWTGRVVEYDDKQLKAANARAHTYRTYTRDKSGESVTLLLLAGHPGEVGAHDPERCYGGAGYRQVGTRTRRQLTDPATAEASSLWTCRFDTDTFPAASVQVDWGWTSGGAWVAADDARFEFVGKSVLYKLYLTRGLSAGGRETDEPTAAFLSAFLPELRKATAP